MSADHLTDKDESSLVDDARAQWRTWCAADGPGRLLRGVVYVAILAAGLMAIISAAPHISRDTLVFAACLVFLVGLMSVFAAVVNGTVLRAVTAIAALLAYRVIVPYVPRAWESLGQTKGAQLLAVEILVAGGLMLGICWPRGRRYVAHPMEAAVAAATWDRDRGIPGDNDIVPRRVAEHEAAHALVWAACGLEVTRVRLYPDAVTSSGARTEFRWCGPYTVDTMWKYMLGSVAPAVWDYDHGYLDLGAQSDVQATATTAHWIIAVGERPAGYDGPLTIDGLLSGAAQQARTLLDEHHRELTHLADIFTQAGAVDLRRNAVDRALEEIGVPNPRTLVSATSTGSIR